MRDIKDVAKMASAGAVMGGALVFTGGAGLAAAQPPPSPSPSPSPSSPAAPPAAPAGGQNDGLVDVKIADITILEDADLGTAALVVAQICDVGMIPPFIEPVDQTGNSQEPCRIEPLGAVTVVQNNPEDTTTPATTRGTETSPSPTPEPTTTQTSPETTAPPPPGTTTQEAPTGPGG